MRIYIFKSEANGTLYAFTGDDDGSKLPPGFAPWQPEGVIESGKPPPHNFSRIRIESAIRLRGFQLWRMKRPVAAASEA
jgi:hypothetical protein